MNRAAGCRVRPSRGAPLSSPSRPPARGSTAGYGETLWSSAFVPRGGARVLPNSRAERSPKRWKPRDREPSTGRSGSTHRLGRRPERRQMADLGKVAERGIRIKLPYPLPNPTVELFGHVTLVEGYA